MRTHNVGYASDCSLAALPLPSVPQLQHLLSNISVPAFDLPFITPPSRLAIVPSLTFLIIQDSSPSRFSRWIDSPWSLKCFIVGPEKYEFMSSALYWSIIVTSGLGDSCLFSRAAQSFCTAVKPTSYIWQGQFHSRCISCSCGCFWYCWAGVSGLALGGLILLIVFLIEIKQQCKKQNNHRYYVNSCLQMLMSKGMLCPEFFRSIKRMDFGNRSLIFLAPVLSTQSDSPPQTRIISILGSTISRGSIAILGMTLGSKYLKNRRQLPSGSKTRVYTIFDIISFQGCKIYTSLMPFIIIDCLQQQQIVRRRDLYVRLKAQPTLFKIVWKTSEQLLMQRLQSYYLVVMPIGESKRSFFICLLDSQGNLTENSKTRQELKEWQMKVQFLWLQQENKASIVFKKNSQISSTFYSSQSFSLSPRPIPLIYHNITFPFFKRGSRNKKLMRELPPNP